MGPRFASETEDAPISLDRRRSNGAEEAPDRCYGARDLFSHQCFVLRPYPGSEADSPGFGMSAAPVPRQILIRRETYDVTAQHGSADARRRTP